MVDAAGNILSTDASQVREQFFTYDELGQQQQVTQIGGLLSTSVAYNYDSQGRKIAEIDPLGNVKQFEPSRSRTPRVTSVTGWRFLSRVSLPPTIFQ